VFAFAPPALRCAVLQTTPAPNFVGVDF